MTTGRVLVTDAERRQSVVAIRSLGRRGLDVTAGAATPLAAGGFSKYASRRFRYPSPTDDEGAFVDALERELARGDYDVLLPVTGSTVLPVVRNRGRLSEHAGIPAPDYGTLVDGLDKKRALDAARDAGVPVPETLAPESLDAEAVESALGYPVVVKPRRQSGRVGVTVCHSPAELRSAFASVREQFGGPLVQEFLPNGGELGVYTVYGWSSELLGLTVQRRIRSNPPEGGPSTLRETVEAPELAGHAWALFSELEWAGPGMAEFRVDARTGEPNLLEVNPRLWGSLSLSVQAGVDVPYMLYRLATEGTCEPALEYRVGVQTRQLLGDLGHVLRRDDRLTALREFLATPDAPRGYDVLSWDDPAVTVGFALGAAGGTLRRTWRDR